MYTVQILFHFISRHLVTPGQNEIAHSLSHTALNDKKIQLITCNSFSCTYKNVRSNHDHVFFDLIVILSASMSINSYFSDQFDERVTFKSFTYRA